MDPRAPVITRGAAARDLVRGEDRCSAGRRIWIVLLAPGRDGVAIHRVWRTGPADRDVVDHAARRRAIGWVGASYGREFALAWIEGGVVVDAPGVEARRAD